MGLGVLGGSKGRAEKQGKRSGTKRVGGQRVGGGIGEGDI